MSWIRPLTALGLLLSVTALIFAVMNENTIDSVLEAQAAPKTITQKNAELRKEQSKPVDGNAQDTELERQKKRMQDSGEGQQDRAACMRDCQDRVEAAKAKEASNRDEQDAGKEEDDVPPIVMEGKEDGQQPIGAECDCKALLSLDDWVLITTTG